ncbi:gp142 [Sphingomonas phage PAU]|uniref:gp142 n=1 Tax=Sphingomonas phage PAU TaxID=1150991 RepID=UPI00025732DA|nr:gp142 [Sphingomonas phage PAU]AFF28140.1 gp142 [Sphingomonas phage PAU]
MKSLTNLYENKLNEASGTFSSLESNMNSSIDSVKNHIDSELKELLAKQSKIKDAKSKTAKAIKVIENVLPEFTELHATYKIMTFNDSICIEFTIPSEIMNDKTSNIKKDVVYFNNFIKANKSELDKTFSFAGVTRYNSEFSGNSYSDLILVLK